MRVEPVRRALTSGAVDPLKHAGHRARPSEQDGRTLIVGTNWEVLETPKSEVFDSTHFPRFREHRRNMKTIIALEVPSDKKPQ
jgi:hypothetical protein